MLALGAVKTPDDVCMAPPMFNRSLLKIITSLSLTTGGFPIR